MLTYNMPAAVNYVGDNHNNVVSILPNRKISHDVRQLDSSVIVIGIRHELSQKDVDALRIVLTAMNSRDKPLLEEIEWLGTEIPGLLEGLAADSSTPVEDYKRLVSRGKETWSRFALRLWNYAVKLADEMEGS